jgi:hypothetical protein
LTDKFSESVYITYYSSCHGVTITSGDSSNVGSAIEPSEFVKHFLDPTLDLFWFAHINFVSDYFALVICAFGLFSLKLIRMPNICANLHRPLVSSRPAMSTSLIAMPLAHSSTSRRVVALPIPEAAPVTANILPSMTNNKMPKYGRRTLRACPSKHHIRLIGRLRGCARTDFGEGSKNLTEHPCASRSPWLR